MIRSCRSGAKSIKIFCTDDSVAKLTKTEWKAAPYVVLANQLVCTIWFSKKEQYQELYEINKKMTWWIIEHFDQLRFEED